MSEFINAKALRERYNISDATVWRWARDPKIDLPPAVVIAGRRYWRLSDLLAFEQRSTKAG